MAFEVDLYQFAKKVNSTARPTSGAVSYNCIIKEPCGMLSPVIGLNLGLATNPHIYNYAYIPTFGRYYFIREWTFQNALWYAALEVDALATWKTDIGNATCYVLRSASQYTDAVVDTTYPGTGTSTLQETLATSPWVTDDIANGTFVVGIAGQSTTYYLFTKAQLDFLFTSIFSDVYAAALTNNWSTTFPQLKAQTNPLQYITSIMWIPFNGLTGTDVTTIRIGWVDVGVVAKRVDGSGLFYGSYDWTIKRHPQAARGSYLNNAPYSNYALFFPPWGTIALDPDVMANSSTITALFGVDLRTGEGTLSVFGGAQHLMSWVHSQVGLHYQVSQVINKGYGLGNTFMPALSTSANILSGNVQGIAGTLATEIGNAAAAKIPSATTIGSNGGLDALRGSPALQYEFKEIVDEDLTNRGRPLCTNWKISELTGYIKTVNPYIDIAATQTERDAIIAYMEGGFFYE